MPTVRVKVMSKGHIVLPREVRKQLGVGPGDTLVFQYSKGAVRTEKEPQADHFGVFGEWSSAGDDWAYRDL
jgi:AbrB family looped-hinge helix DNA binding protein